MKYNHQIQATVSQKQDVTFLQKVLNIFICLSEDLQSTWLLRWDKIQWILSYIFSFKQGFCHEFPCKTIMQLYLSAVGSLFATYLYNVMDGIFVGRGFGSAALGAVNIGVPFTTFSVALVSMFPILCCQSWSLPVWFF